MAQSDLLQAEIVRYAKWEAMDFGEGGAGSAIAGAFMDGINRLTVCLFYKAKRLPAGSRFSST
jgi:hypothetical protein